MQDSVAFGFIVGPIILASGIGGLLLWLHERRSVSNKDFESLDDEDIARAVLFKMLVGAILIIGTGILAVVKAIIDLYG